MPWFLATRASPLPSQMAAAERCRSKTSQRQEKTPKSDSAELPNPYEVVLTTSRNEQVELPWDFVRHYCDPTYRPKMKIIASEAKKALGTRVQLLREAAGLTQEALAKAAGIERVTLVNLEYGRNAPKLTTLDTIAQALGRPIEDLLTAQEDSMTNIFPSQRQKNNSAT